MRTYVRVTGVLFTLIAVAQLARTVAGVPVKAAEIDIPVWWSGVAFVVMALLALWAYRTDRQAT